MGLRLYKARVESDIQSKPPTEKASAQSRSSIRRSTASRVGSVPQVSEYSRQLRHLDSAHRSALREGASATAQDNTDRNATWGLQSDSDSSSDAPATGENTADNRALRHIRRAGILDDHIVALFGERWAQLHASAAAPGPSGDPDDSLTVPPLSAMALEPDFLPPHRRPFAEAYATSSMRSTQAPGHTARRTARPSTSLARLSRLSGTNGYRRVDSEAAHTSRRERLQRLRRAVESNTSFDGLGDRNRSLSPEGDHVWDTLLTTISPDPQPPSVGSSFASASASASATASQGAATGSSRTSFGAVDELLASLEPQCESGCETSSDTEGEDDDSGAQILTSGPWGPRLPLPRQATVPYSRSYADVTRSSRNDNPVADMQRIVMGLAQREDIPDEWWAEAGLGRILSRDASTQ